MPYDSRRINGPPESFSLTSFVTSPRKSSTVGSLSDKKTRLDGRHSTEIRPIYLKAGVVQQANGSAYLETSGTKLTCSVFGPRDYVKKQEFSSRGKLTCEFAFLPFSRSQRSVDVRADEKLCDEYSNIITQSLVSSVCLESYPKSQIDVYINVLEDDGNTLSYAIAAASIALADAGIEMMDLVTSSTLIFNEHTHWLDPSVHEQNDFPGSMTVAYLPSLNQISCLLQDGELEVNKSIELTNVCIEGCLRMHELMKDCLLRSPHSGMT